MTSAPGTASFKAASAVSASAPGASLTSAFVYGSVGTAAWERMRKP